jgi:hypothetical protein
VEGSMEKLSEGWKLSFCLELVWKIFQWNLTWTWGLRKIYYVWDVLDGDFPSFWVKRQGFIEFEFFDLRILVVNVIFFEPSGVDARNEQFYHVSVALERIFGARVIVAG